MRKSNHSLLAALLAMTAVTFATSCSDDDNFSDVDGKAPTIALETDHIQTEAGRQFTIAGQVKDADGIRSIRLQNSDMLLDKTINLLELYGDSLIYDYKLAYKYTSKKDWTDSSSFPVNITVEDIGGRTTSATLTVSADGDFTNPEFSVAPSGELTVLVQNPKLTLGFTVTDNKRLNYIQVECPALGINDRIDAAGQSEMKVKKVYEVPSEKQSCLLTVTAYDKFNNKVMAQSTVNVDEMPDFEKMYLADVESAKDLTSDVYGVPMVIDHTGPYEYTAHYYNQKAGTKVRFIPQMTDFEPICFGVDPSDNSVLINDASSAIGIELNEVAYYEIKLNIVTGAYSVKTYQPTTEKMTLDGSTTIDFGDGSGAQPAQICLAGGGLPGTPSWTTNQNNDAFILSQDAANKYLLYRECELEAGTEIEYTISQTHWWGWWPEPYWRFDGSEFNEKNVKNGGDNMKKSKVPATGKYRIEFDYHLLRSRIIPVK
ncbi:MAG: hypothetical protein PUB65_06580 [Prevotellaceae bacterium]|nr:hypothetical protein [Prevotellaceae bacterium]